MEVCIVALVAASERIFIMDTDDTFPLTITQKFGIPFQQGMQV